MKYTNVSIGLVLIILLTLGLFQYYGGEDKNLSRIPEQKNVGAIQENNLSEVVRMAEKFKATLSEDQKALLQLDYSKTDAAKWSNFPQGATHPKRVGIGLGQLDATQKKTAKALMALILDEKTLNEGFDELEGILAADDYFGRETDKKDFFGSDNFFIAFLGEPTTTGLWELQFGGHHLAISNTYDHGKLVGMTPAFRGVEPMKPVEANGRSYQPMEQERQAFKNIIAQLKDARKQAKLTATFNDILLGPGKDDTFPEKKEGLKVGFLTKAQQKLVLSAIELYVKDLQAEEADKLLTRYKEELQDTFVAYSGSGSMEATGDYFRIDGPSVWIEYSAQPSRDFPGTTHPHSIWRDRKSDYGGH